MVLFLMQAKEQLSPAEKVLDDVSTLTKPMKPQLMELKDLLQKGGQQAQDALEDAGDAADEAASGKDVRDFLFWFET